MIQQQKDSYIYQGVKPIARNKGTFITLEISHEWTPTLPSRNTDHVVIVQFGKYFSNEEEVENFKRTPLYKEVFKAAINTCQKYQE